MNVPCSAIDGCNQGRAHKLGTMVQTTVLQLTYAHDISLCHSLKVMFGCVKLASSSDWPHQDLQATETLGLLSDMLWQALESRFSTNLGRVPGPNTLEPDHSFCDGRLVGSNSSTTEF